MVVRLDVCGSFVTNEFGFDFEFLFIKIRPEFNAFDVTIIWDILKPNTLPNPTGWSIPNSASLIRLLASRKNRGIGVILCHHFNDIGFIEIRNVHRYRRITARVMGNEATIEIDIANLIDSIEMKDGVVTHINIRNLKAFAVVKKVVCVHHDALPAQRSLGGK